MPNLLIGRNRALLSRRGAPPSPGGMSKSRFDVARVDPNAPSYAPPALNIGAATGDRMIVYAAGAILTASDLVTVSATVGGAALTLDRAIRQTAAGTRWGELGFAMVPSGEEVAFLLVAGVSSIQRLGFACWLVKRSAQASWAGRSGTVPTSTGSNTSLPLGAVTVPEGGFGFGFGFQNTADPLSVTMTTGVADADDDLAGAGGRFVAFDTAVAGSQNPTIANANSVASNMRGGFLTIGP